MGWDGMGRDGMGQDGTGCGGMVRWEWDAIVHDCLSRDLVGWDEDELGWGEDGVGWVGFSCG